MAKTHAAQETRLKAQAFDAITRLKKPKPPGKILSALQDTPVFKQVDYAALILFQPTAVTEDREAKIAAAYFSEPLALPKAGQRLSPRTAGWLWATGKETLMQAEDIQSDARFALFAAEKSVHAMLAVALKDDNFVGWLVLLRTGSDVFAADDAQFMQLLAPYIAHNIAHRQNLKTLQDQLSRTQRLFEFNREIMRVAHTSAVYQKITQMFLSVGAEVCLLATILDAVNEDVPVKITALDHKNVGINPDDFLDRTYSLADYPIIAHLRETQRPKIVNNLKNDATLSLNEREFFGALKLKAVVVLYLQSQADATPLGYLILGYTRSRPFSDGHIAFFQQLAEQVARAIDFHSKLETMGQRARQLETGAKVSEVASRVLDEKQIINQAVELIKEGFGLYYVGLFLMDEDEAWAILRAGSGEAGRAQIEAGHKLAANADESMIGWAIVNRRARIALDIGQDAVRFENPFLPDTRSEMALPLISQGQVLGALSIQSTAVAAFSQEDITSLQIMADQLANAILNARLYKNAAESSRKLNSLLEINRDITASGDLQQLLDSIIRHAAELAQADQGTIFLLEGDELIPKSVVGGFVEEMFAVRPKLGEGVSGTAAQTRQPVTRVFHNPADGLQIPGTPEIPESLAAVPIQTETHVIGVMLIRRINNTQPFSQADIALLEGMALQAAIAYQNLTLLTSIEKNFRREQVIRQLVARIHSASGVQNILQTTVTELTKALNAPGGAVRLKMKPQTGTLTPSDDIPAAGNGDQPFTPDIVEE